MAKKKDIFPDADKIIAIVNRRVDDVKEFMVAFKNDAEKKIDHTRDAIKEETSKIDKRLERLEEKNETLTRHQIELDAMRGEVNSLCTEFHDHLKYHDENEPKLAVSKFQVLTMWTIFGIILTGIVTKTFGIWDQFLKWLSK
jgi:predicted RNase H-like nuclease (RuvC/YqgF family)